MPFTAVLTLFFSFPSFLFGYSFLKVTRLVVEYSLIFIISCSIIYHYSGYYDMFFNVHICLLCSVFLFLFYFSYIFPPLFCFFDMLLLPSSFFFSLLIIFIIFIYILSFNKSNRSIIN